MPEEVPDVPPSDRSGGVAQYVVFLLVYSIWYWVEI